MSWKFIKVYHLLVFFTITLCSYGIPSTTPTPSTYTTFRAWYFEGVDYTLTPRAYKEKNDCYALYIWPALYQVCGFDRTTKFFEDFYNVCEIEIINCEYRTTVYGTQKGEKGRRENKVFYNGELYHCSYYRRNSNSPEELEQLYFGGDKETVLAEWDAQSRAQHAFEEKYEALGLEGVLEQEEQRAQDEASVGREVGPLDTGDESFIFS